MGNRLLVVCVFVCVVLSWEEELVYRGDGVDPGEMTISSPCQDWVLLDSVCECVCLFVCASVGERNVHRHSMEASVCVRVWKSRPSVCGAVCFWRRRRAAFHDADSCLLHCSAQLAGIHADQSGLPCALHTQPQKSESNIVFSCFSSLARLLSLSLSFHGSLSLSLCVGIVVMFCLRLC
jgi:hypothetical protein